MLALSHRKSLDSSLILNVPFYRDALYVGNWQVTETMDLDHESIVATASVSCQSRLDDLQSKNCKVSSTG